MLSSSCHEILGVRPVALRYLPQILKTRSSVFPSVFSFRHSRPHLCLFLVLLLVLVLVLVQKDDCRSFDRHLTDKCQSLRVQTGLDICDAYCVSVDVSSKSEKTHKAYRSLCTYTTGRQRPAYQSHLLRTSLSRSPLVETVRSSKGPDARHSIQNRQQTQSGGSTGLLQTKSGSQSPGFF